jgi:hypothetical protein
MAEDPNEGRRAGNVELPERKKEEDLGISRFKVKSAVFIVVAATVAFILLILWLFLGREARIQAVPVLEKAWIVSRLEGEDIATDKPKLVSDGRGVMLYLVAYGLDRTNGNHYYYTETPTDKLPRIVIGGREIQAEQVRPFEFLDAMSIVGWYKLEVSPHFFRDVGRPIWERLFWTDSRKHNMGNRWWAIADVRADLFTDYHYDYVGTMRFTADVLTFHARDPELVYSNIKTEGSKPAQPGGMPPGAHRITIIPPQRSGLDRTYRAFFNLFVWEEQQSPTSAGELTEAFLGGNSRSILIGSMRLLGYEVAYDDPEFLEKYCRRLYADVTLDQFGFFRPGGRGDEVILYGESGVQPGDILVTGNRYLVLVQNGNEMAEPEEGALTSDDQVLDAYNGLVVPTFARVLEKEQGPIEIWRLKPVESTTPVD